MSSKKHPGVCPKCGLWNDPSESRCRSCDTPLTGLAAMSTGKRSQLSLLILGAAVAGLILVGSIVAFLIAAK